MAFFKKVQKAINRLWYPQSCLVGKPVTTDQIAKRLAAESTVAPADVKAVLEALSGVMGDYMAQGRSVKLDGIGSFFFQAQASGNGKAQAEDVSAGDINGVRVHFTPETTYRRQGGKGGGRRAVRALTDVDIEWIDVSTLGVQASGLSEDDEELNDGDTTNDGGSSSGGTSSGDAGGNGDE